LSQQQHDVDPEAHRLHDGGDNANSQSLPVNSDPLDRIRKRFIERCCDDLERLRQLRTSCAYRDNEKAFSTLSAIAHSLAGAGGTLGFPEISSKAFELESRLIEGNAGEATTSALDELIAELNRIAPTSG
jgi:HPt (histidine-containing phosphotransfer) domain-containing protein